MYQEVISFIEFAASKDLAIEKGPYESYKGSPWYWVSLPRTGTRDLSILIP